VSNYTTWDLYSLGTRILEWRERAKQAATLQQRRSYEGEIEVMGREFDRKFFTGPYWPVEIR
jgi:hypothetical protein